MRKWKKIVVPAMVCFMLGGMTGCKSSSEGTATDVSAEEEEKTTDEEESDEEESVDETETMDESLPEDGSVSENAVDSESTVAEENAENESSQGNAEQNTTEAVTENVIQPPTVATTPAPAPAPTEAPTEAPTPAPTEAPTEAPTPAPTEAPTEAPTPAPTEAPTKAPVAQSVVLPVKVSERASKLADKVVGSIIDSSMSEFDKVKAIHDYIVKNVRYDYVNAVNDTLPETSYTAEGALAYKTAVCQGYAEAFSLLCYKAGIQTEMVTGTADNGNGAQGHAWNLVRVDGVWYQIDTTWDDPITIGAEYGESIKYTYFLVPDSVMNEDHTAKSYTNKHTCTDKKYVEYGYKQTIKNFVESSFPNAPYEFASNDTDIETIISNNYGSGQKSFTIVYNTGEKLSATTLVSQNTINNIIHKVHDYLLETISMGEFSIAHTYEHDSVYLVINITLK